jgi:hypothetical protein
MTLNERFDEQVCGLPHTLKQIAVASRTLDALGLQRPYENNCGVGPTKVPLNLIFV